MSDRTQHESDRSLDIRMQDARSVADAAGLDRFSLLGISEGGVMASLFAATYPDRTQSLIIFGSTPRVLYADDWPWGIDREALTAFREGIAEQWGTGVTASIFAGEYAEARRESQARYERQGTSPAGFRQILRVFADIDVRDVLPTIRVPTLVAHGTQDVVPVDVARWVASTIPGARLCIYEGPHTPTVAPSSVWDEVETFVTGAAPTVASDRTLATVLFTDIVDSTARAATIGDEAWRRVLGRHDAVVRSHLAHYRGVEVKHTGDGVLATFDGPGRAVECAVALAAAIRPVGLEIRAGVHTGEIERHGNDIAGIAVHVGARIAALAGPSEVLVSRTVRDLVAGSRLQFEDRGLRALKGVPDEWQVYAASIR